MTRIWHLNVFFGHKLILKKTLLNLKMCEIFLVQEIPLNHWKFSLNFLLPICVITPYTDNHPGQWRPSGGAKGLVPPLELLREGHCNPHWAFAPLIIFHFKVYQLLLLLELHLIDKAFSLISRLPNMCDLL